MNDDGNGPNHDQAGESIQRLAQLLIFWHVLVAVGATLGLYGLFSNQVAMPDWVRWFTIGALLLMGLGSGGAVIFIPQRNHRGRTLSLLVNYVGFLFSVRWPFYN